MEHIGLRYMYVCRRRSATQNRVIKLPKTSLDYVTPNIWWDRKSA